MGLIVIAMGSAVALRQGLSDAEELLQFGVPATAAGGAILTSGHMRPGLAARRWTDDAKVTLAGWIGGVLLAIVAAFLLPADEAQSRAWGTALTAAFLGAVAGWFVLWFLGRRIRNDWEPESDWTIQSVVIASFIAMFAITGVPGYQDFYPFSPFRMYSVVQSDPRTFDSVTFVGVGADGRTYNVPPQISRNTLVALVRNDDVDRMEATASAAAAAFEQRRQVDLETVRVFFDQLIIPPYPAAPAIELDQRILAYEFAH